MLNRNQLPKLIFLSIFLSGSTVLACADSDAVSIDTSMPIYNATNFQQQAASFQAQVHQFRNETWSPMYAQIHPLVARLASQATALSGVALAKQEIVRAQLDYIRGSYIDLQNAAATLPGMDGDCGMTLLAMGDSLRKMGYYANSGTMHWTPSTWVTYYNPWWGSHRGWGHFGWGPQSGWHGGGLGPIHSHRGSHGGHHRR